MPAIFRKQAADFAGHCNTIAMYIIMIIKHKYMYSIMYITTILRY